MAAVRVAATDRRAPRVTREQANLEQVFLQLTADNNPDLPLPGRSYTFGTLKNAQAQGDLEALRSYDRRTLRVDLGANALEGVKKLTAALK